MMRSVFFLCTLFLIGSIYGQPGTTGKAVLKVKQDALDMRNDMAFYKDQPFTGVSFTFWDNKRVNEETSWKAGLKDGVYKEYTETSILVTTITWAGGRKNGPYIYNYPNGAKQSEGNFKNDQLDGEIWGYYTNGFNQYLNTYSAGIRNGAAKTWFPNGAVEQISNFVNDIPDGMVTAYYPDSLIRYECEYSMGIKNGHYYKYHRSGCPAEEMYFKNGLQDSVFRIWDELTCKLLQQGFFTKGEKNGAFIQYEFDGDTLKIATYKGNKLNGPFKEWKDRLLETTGQYENGEMDGYWHFGMGTHYQFREGTFDHGIMVGIWKFYDQKGKLLMLQTYDDEGNLKKEKRYRRAKK